MRILSQLKNRFKLKSTSRRGASSLIVFAFALVVFWGLTFFHIETLAQVAKKGDLNQISQIMAREISLTGKVDNSTYNRLDDLKQTFGLDVHMNVDGNFIRNTNKLELETPVEVTITYNTEYRFGLIGKKKEKTYVAKSVSTVEEYHK